MAQDEQPYQMHSDTKNSPETVALQGGTWDLNGNTENVDILALSSGGTLETSASGTACLTNISGYNDTLSGLCYFDVVTNSGVLNLAGIISGDGTETLVKTGLGTLNLCSNNIYTGGTVISNGTLALFGAGSISNTALINLATNSAILDLSSNTVSQTLALQSGQTLAGFGTVNGLVQAASGAVVAPGSASVIGTLTVTGAGVNTLNGTTTMKLDKGHSTSDQLAVSGSLVYGGTLALSNLSGSLAVGDTFTLFPGASGYSGAFAAISPATPGSGLSWNTSKLAVNGTLSIAVGAAAPPGFSTLTLSGTTLSIHGTNGPANQSFVLLGTTNLVTPVQNWTPLLTNAFDGSGNFNVSISATNAAEFLLLQTK
jgi:autotransporter-associated beta strand protein